MSHVFCFLFFLLLSCEYIEQPLTTVTRNADASLTCGLRWVTSVKP